MTGRGSRRERAVTEILRGFDYLVSSRRHEGGAGDLLAIAAGVRRTARPLLIEVKGTLDPPWRSTWGPDERAAMIETGLRFDLTPLLAWWPPGFGAPIWLPVEDWPA